MCGLAGIISLNPSVINRATLQKMSDAVVHRGPDGEGLWINEQNTAGFSHRRLSIIDLSEAGAQPMHYMDRYTIVYNGEIYNYIELREELQRAGYTFNSECDTEVILAAYDKYKTRCLQHFDGMFSFAIWDEQKQRLFAARDRFGEKPFYYHTNSESFYFGNEMKALWAAGIPKSSDEKMLLNYLTLGYVQDPTDKSHTFFKGITSLKPAHYLLLDGRNNTFTTYRYWDLNKQVTQKFSEKLAIKRFDTFLTTSIQRRLRSDVSIGTSLSGGLDSSSISYYMHELLSKEGKQTNFKTFSAVFPGFHNDESSFIQQVTDSLQLKNYQVTPDSKQLLQEFETMAYHQEEPFPSSSIFAQYKVFQLAKQHGAKVLLDGQGADEILAGYHRYAHWFLQELVSRSRFTRFNREKKLLLKNNIDPGWSYKNVLAAYLPSHAAMQLEKNEYSRIIHNHDISSSMRDILRGKEWESIYKPVITKLNDILYFNTMQNGLEELLRYADRNAMAHGVEVRLPFLNAELVQFIFTLPSSYKINRGYPKWILRRLVDKKLPDSITWRKEKVGYEPPQKQWMQDPDMQDYVHESKRKLVDHNILKPSVLDHKPIALDAHAASNYDWRYMCAARIIE